MAAALTTSPSDLVPLAERIRVLALLRVGYVALVLGSWFFLPGADGAPLLAVVIASAALLALTTAISLLRTAFGARATWVFGITAMLDALYLAWASYGTNGLSSILTYLLLIQLVTVCLLASSRTAVKLALWDALLLICAFYAQRAAILSSFGNPHVRISGGYLAVCVYSCLFFIAALVTSTFAAINERELRRRRYDLEALAQLALRLEEVDEPHSVAQVLLDGVADAFGYERGIAFEASSGQLTVLAASGVEPGSPQPGASIDLSHAQTTTYAIEHNERMLVDAASAKSDAAIGICARTRPAIVIPLHADRPLGVLVLEHPLRRGSRVERRVVTMLERFCSHASLALANAKLLSQIRDQAVTDALTGLANRGRLDAALTHACAEARREGRPLGVVMIDLDDFKALNDRDGHQTGDRVLQLTGRALAQTTRATDIPARYGGEEFCIVMPGADLATAYPAAGRWIKAISEACGDHGITASAGVACALDHGITPEALLHAADRALYEAKRQGRNRVVAAGPSPGRPTEHERSRPQAAQRRGPHRDGSRPSQDGA